MDKKTLGLGLLGLLVVATLWFVVGGLLQDPVKSAADPKALAEGAAKDDEATGANQASGVKREDPLKLEAPGKAEANLQLPGQLPSLAVPKDQLPVAPTQPHGQLELEGELQEADAELAIRAVFPAIRDCYVELRQRAPQARGRMLMKFAVRPGAEPGQAALGELFLKETQFTDPKYLTCVRAAIDNGRFPTNGKVNGAVTVPLFLAPQDAGETP